MKFNIIFLIVLYHYLFHNGLEKLFIQTFFNKNKYKRPLNQCNDKFNKLKLFCTGMPSGHCEILTCIIILLYLYKYIDYKLCYILIFIVGLQRIYTKMHTLNQVIIGTLLGIFYALIYKHYNLEYKSLFIVILFGFVIASSILYNIDKQIKSPIPEWIDKKMIPIIRKKQNISFIYKLSHIYWLVKNQNFILFITWSQLESYLDIIIERIQKSNIKYDGIVGIKTGGAILASYLQKKLNLPMYTVKISRKEYDFIDNIIKKKYIIQDTFMICEEITESLDNKNIILLDEQIDTGKTISYVYKYLKEEKKVNYIYPTVISSIYKNDKINNIFNNGINIWPWGYR